MFELLILFVVFAVLGGVLFLGLALAWMVRLAVNVVLLPVTLACFAVQGVLWVVAIAVGLVLLFTVGLPLLLAAAMLLLPLLALGALVWGGIALLTAIA